MPASEFITMHGPSFDGEGIEEQEVDFRNVHAYKQHGWVEGPAPAEEVEESEGEDPDEEVEVPDDGSDQKPLSKMNKAELRTAAEVKAIEVTAGMTNKQIIAAIEAAE